jgi:hypothetical protein
VINNLYSTDCMVGPAKAQSPPAANETKTQTAQGWNATKSQSPQAPNSTQSPAVHVRTRSLVALSDKISNLMTDAGELREYIANIHVDPTALGGSFKLYLFDGAVEGRSSIWDRDSSYLGSHVFTSNRQSGPRRGTNRNRYVAGAVTLTSSLMGRVQRGVLSGMSNEEVESYLGQRLIWKGVKVCPCSIITISPCTWLIFSL